LEAGIGPHLLDDDITIERALLMYYG